ncbi:MULTISPECIES: MFS transporter [Paenibacillus]|uniref:staphylopine family metallophore export MFS transporter CntE n=1 Tax=Paenibacillus TaxID=44249 RepID=UPI0006CFB6CA|nr:MULTISPECIES: MFS transporter [Paenibacillus]SDJ70057.1 Predicted arabinose efflux permease, MFS family [Paenibacillus naphthalenovorans]
MKGALSWPFLRLYVLTLLYFSGNSILNVIIPLKGESLGASNSTIGLIMGAYLLTTMFFRPWAGGLIQRYGAIRVLRVLLTVNGLALLLYTFTGLEGYFLARVLQGVCTAFFSMALQLGVIEALPDKDRAQGISMYSLCSYLPGIFGPLLAIGMWQSGETGGMGLFAVSMIAIAILTGIVGFTARIGGQPDDTASGEEGRGPAGASGREGERRSPAAAMLRATIQLGSNPHLFRCGVLMLSASVVFGAVTAFVPLYAPQIQGGNAAVYLMIQAAVVVAARFLLRSWIPSDGKWRSSFVGGLMMLLVTASLAVGLSPSAGAALFYTGAVLLGIAQALLYPTLTTYLSFVLPKAERGVLIGLFIATADLGVSLGGIIMGPVSDLTSYSSMYLICAALAAAAALLALQRRVRQASSAS